MSTSDASPDHERDRRRRIRVAQPPALHLAWIAGVVGLLGQVACEHPVAGVATADGRPVVAELLAAVAGLRRPALDRKLRQRRLRVPIGPLRRRRRSRLGRHAARRVPSSRQPRGIGVGEAVAAVGFASRSSETVASDGDSEPITNSTASSASIPRPSWAQALRRRYQRQGARMGSVGSQARDCGARRCAAQLSHPTPSLSASMSAPGVTRMSVWPSSSHVMPD